MRCVAAFIYRIWFLAGVLIFPAQGLYSQQTSKDNYSGDWAAPGSWNPSWAIPETSVIDINITVYGFLTANSPLSFSGSGGLLSVYDTLVIKGDLTISNNSRIIIEDRGVLIVRGNIIMDNQATIIANGYLMVTGDFKQTGASGLSLFTSNDDPVKVFIGGALIPANLNNDPAYPVLNCASPPTIAYQASACSYGNLADLANDPISQFFNSTCGAATAGSNSPVCEGSAINLNSSDGGTNYSWSGPNSFSSILQNPVISSATLADAGKYSVIVTLPDGCQPVANTDLLVNPLPSAGGSITGNVLVCQGNSGIAYTTDLISGAEGYLWTLPPGAIITSGANTNSIIVDYSSSSVSGNITVSGTNSCGSGPASPLYAVTVNPTPSLVITNPASVCAPATVDLTSVDIFSGSTPGLNLTFWNDNKATIAMSDPAYAVDGTYYIKGVTTMGCYSIKPVTVIVNPRPNVVVSQPAAVCSPATVDLTSAAITAGSTAGLTFSYWKNSSATSSYSTPTAATNGTYYIKGTSPDGCFDIKSVIVTVNTSPTVVISNPAPVCSPATVDLTSVNVFTGSTPGLNLTFWTDDQATRAMSDPAAASTGTYYIKGVTPEGCYDIKPIVVVVNPGPDLFITNPDTQCSPATADLTSSLVTQGSAEGLIFTYWTNIYATTAYPTPSSATSGTYFIKGSASGGCYSIKPVTVIIKQSPTLIITDPTAVCGTATVDITADAITSGSTSGLIYTYWKDQAAAEPYSAPATATSGTYYIKGTSSDGCYTVQSVNVVINPLPSVTITSSNTAMCLTEKRPLTANLTGGTFAITSGPGVITGDVLSATAPGNIAILYSYTDKCTNTASQVIAVDDFAESFPGPDQELVLLFETDMAAELSASQTGEWSLVSGSGKISDPTSPHTHITDLATGDNRFKWTVHSGACRSDSIVKILVVDLFLPSVITPNGDGKNDLFVISALEVRSSLGHAQLIVIDKWGNEVYSSHDYANDWDGKNNKGAELREDTYYFILKFENGIIKKGSVLIKR